MIQIDSNKVMQEVNDRSESLKNRLKILNGEE